MNAEIVPAELSDQRREGVVDLFDAMFGDQCFQRALDWQRVYNLVNRLDRRIQGQRRKTNALK